MSNSVSTHLMFFGAASEAMQLYQSEFAEFRSGKSISMGILMEKWPGKSKLQR